MKPVVLIIMDGWGISKRKEGNAVFLANAPNYDIMVIEKNLNSMWYTLDMGITNTTFTELTGTINQLLWDHVIIGEVNLTFYAQDNNGNIGKEYITIIKSISEIPSYNVWAIIIVFSIGVILIILRTRIRNKIISK